MSNGNLEKRSPRYALRIEPELKAKMEEQAAKRDMSLAAWLKMLATNEIERQERLDRSRK
jgi:predicted HicB family RNase H-like nuclease